MNKKPRTSSKNSLNSETHRIATPIAGPLLAWYDRYGRRDLPWQHPRSPYRVWVAEIMLQQTQVATVVDYFERFMQRFPTVAELAEASLDEVLANWAGLGYYARGRNLHHAARIITTRFGGELPGDLTALVRLPGIGRSTAGAILAQAFDQRHAILDGNVKRVLSRYHAVPGWPGRRETERTLWAWAEFHTPHERLADYTQAIMDLGATVCRSRRPDCPNCPIAPGCRALALGSVEQFPEKRPKAPMPEKHTAMVLVINNDAQILLERRPPLGIWGGLLSLPEMDENADVRAFCRETLCCDITDIERGPPYRHTFSHFHLLITPYRARFKEFCGVMADERRDWYNLETLNKLGLATPIRRLIQTNIHSTQGIRAV